MCGRPRESRTARPCDDHLLYESRDPRKKGRPARPGSRRARLNSPLARRDHGPDGPNGPDGHRRPLSTASPGVLRLGTQLFAFAQASPGPSRLDGPDTAKGISNLRRTPSRRVVPKCWSGRPQAPRASARSGGRLNPLWLRRHDIPAGRMSGRSSGAVCAVVPAVVPGERLERRSTPTWGPSRAPGPIAVVGIIVGASLLCFRFAFDRGASP